MRNRPLASHSPSTAANLPDLHCRFEVLEIGVHLYLEGWFTCMFAKVSRVPCIFSSALECSVYTTRYNSVTRHSVFGAPARFPCVGLVLMRWRNRSVRNACIYFRLFHYISMLLLKRLHEGTRSPLRCSICAEPASLPVPLKRLCGLDTLCTIHVVSSHCRL